MKASQKLVSPRLFASLQPLLRTRNLGSRCAIGGIAVATINLPGCPHDGFTVESFPPKCGWCRARAGRLGDDNRYHGREKTSW